MASLLTATVVIGGAPIVIFLWPAPPKGQKKTSIKVSLTKPISQIANADAVKFDAPTSPNSAFIMADGGGDNAAGDLAFGGFVVKDATGKVNVFAINCSHLGCSIALNTDAKTFDCPCHGSRFHLDGSPPKQFRQSRVPAVRAGQRPVLTWNDPLNIFGNQRE